MGVVIQKEKEEECVASAQGVKAVGFFQRHTPNAKYAGASVLPCVLFHSSLCF